jgi:hypothetical protein
LWQFGDDQAESGAVETVRDAGGQVAAAAQQDQGLGEVKQRRTEAASRKC